MSCLKVVDGSEYYTVLPWCNANPTGKVIIGVNTQEDAARVAGAIPKYWKGTACIVFSDADANGMLPGFRKTMAAARIKLSLFKTSNAISILYDRREISTVRDHD